MILHLLKLLLLCYKKLFALLSEGGMDQYMFWLFRKHYMQGNRPIRSVHGTAPSSAFPALSSFHEYDLLFRKMFSLGNEVLCVLNESLDCLYLSHNWQQLTGLEPDAESKSMFRSRFLSCESGSMRDWFTDDAITRKALRFQIGYANGTLHWHELCLIGKHETVGIPHYICLIRNANERMEAEIQFKKARFEADMANKSRAEFLANMSHELRTPLNAIIGFAQMMENSIYGTIGHPKYNDYIHNIQKSGVTLLGKINDLLEIADINSGRMQLNEAACDLVPIIHSAIEFHSHRAFNAKVDIREWLPVKAVPVLVDRIRLLQVLGNVLCNAIKYSKAGDYVDVYYEKRKDGGINIVVEDKGGGIPPGHLQRMRETFQADHSFFNRNRDCVGLGLAVSQEIIRLHQGKIEIQSEQGKGTVLRVMLPPERSLKPALKKTRQLKGMLEEM